MGGYQYRYWNGIRLQRSLICENVKSIEYSIRRVMRLSAGIISYLSIGSTTVMLGIQFEMIGVKLDDTVIQFFPVHIKLYCIGVTVNHSNIWMLVVDPRIDMKSIVFKSSVRRWIDLGIVDDYRVTRSQPGLDLGMGLG